MSTIATVNNTAFAESFWSVDTTAQEILFKQHEKGTKTLNSLVQFYKEFMHLESEYSRKFNSIIGKLELPKHEYASTLKTSIDVFQEQCLKISESHSLQSRRVYDSLQIPLQEIVSERKAREKSMETRIQQSWSALLLLKANCVSKSEKYEEIWNEICNLKSKKLTLDQIELQRLDEKLEKMKKKMFQIREDNWNLVNKYNENLKNWLILWWESCNELQTEEEKRIRFIKANLWEFANILNTFCVEEDKYCDNIRTSLQDCSARKNVDIFSRQFKTGNETFAPMTFVDFTKNETRPLTEHTTQKFDPSQLPFPGKTPIHTKRNPPPKLDETTETAFEMIGKSKELFKELQEEAQKEASQMRLKVPKADDENLSEPSTNVMSNYSNPTTHTSVSSESFNESIQKNFKTQLNEFTKGSHEADGRDDINKPDTTMPGRPEDISNFENKNIFRESMIPAQGTDKNAKRKSLTNIFKKAFSETPERIKPEVFEYKQILPKSNTQHAYTAEKPLRPNSLMPTEEDIKKASKLMKPERRAKNSVRKSKSQYNMNNTRISLNDLPTTSIEGFPVIAHCKALYSYQAQIEEELSFKKRDILLVLHKQKDGWWFAENLSSNDSGLVPCNYLEEIR
ncbi:hypothetical protein CANINC_002926 [Pichia inconspicua]|uniref:SH3 domain-containing protein n=1 Tax=Pichia inconspicua TaxID=52247 RepID=A0A4T0X017_9ASCO|nr:hypothetical protein CANINC_002926 [[Candida] inconspicua]